MKALGLATSETAFLKAFEIRSSRLLDCDGAGAEECG